MSSRRKFIALTGRAAFASAITPRLLRAADGSPPRSGAIVGDAVAARAGEQVLREGGNAIDAAIAAAFAAGICSARNCGVGGYGGHAMIALAGGTKITAIDFNSTAPAAARADMFSLDSKGSVIGQANTYGWLAAGVPGTAAGLELALRRYGTRSLREILAPAIALCASGAHVAPVKGIDDTGPAAAGNLPRERRRNSALLELLRTLAARDSTESFYRGDLATTIAEAFRKNGGLVTLADLAAYRATEIAPLSLAWNDAALHTVPLTSTGPLVLEALAALQALDWPALPPRQRLHAKLEALRIAWADRLRTFGDPDHVAVPLAALLSASHAADSAGKISAALRTQRPVPLTVEPNLAGGTTNISATDRAGNMIAITLTHGGSFGSRAVVDELGMVLGHGMSRFDPRPGRPNSVGPGKRPITNMCPSIVTRGGIPVLAVGGAGGTRIPSSVFEVLLNSIALGAPLATAMAAPRLNTDGTLALGLDKLHSAQDRTYFTSLGYKVTTAPSAVVSAVSYDPATGTSVGISTGGA